MSKKILEVIDAFYPQVDGVVKVVNNYATLMNEENECAVICPDYKIPVDREFKYKVVHKKSLCFKVHDIIFPFPVHCRKTNKFIKEFKPDVIHVHSPFFIGHYALKKARKMHVPCIATFHSQFKRDVMEITHSKLITKFVVWYIVRFFNKCDEVWAVSKATANTLKSYGYKKEIFVVKNGTEFVYPKDMDECKKKAQEMFKIDTNKKNLVFVGQIRAVKNLPLIIDSLAEVSKKYTNFHMYFIGEGPDQKSLEKRAKSLGILEYITFTGRINDPKILQGFYGSSDLMFFPSVYDNNSIAVMEACVCELPSLLTEGANTAEGFIDGENGFLAKENFQSMAEKLLYIFENPEKSRECGKRAAKTIPFRWEDIIGEALDRYDLVLKNYRSSDRK